MTGALDRFISFDPAIGIIDCEAGVLLADIIALALPHGWFLPVTPGTRFVTIGGAIANDVHGKNHAFAGSFGDHIDELELLRSDDTRLVCSTTTNSEWFAATIGGLGLTGVITRARIRLRRVSGSALDLTEQRFSGLDGYFDHVLEAEQHEYTVAWVDSTARDKSLGRGIFQTANHAPLDHSAPPPPRARLDVSVTPPFSLINRITVPIFNAQHYARGARRPTTRRTHYTRFFYPLDSVGHWNRLYGPKGFLQYQCVIPHADAHAAIREILQRVARAGSGSFLTVLKQFGSRPPPGLLSFPRAGTTLAIDFPFQGPETLALLDSLDAVTTAAKGAVYPAKDARMKPETFAASFPRLTEFRDFIDPRFSSGLWRRMNSDA